jgi:Icc-related predicted phosphoesterase
MRLIFLADLHFSLKQFDWVVAHAREYDVTIIGGDLLDLGSSLDIDTQITVVEKYLGLLAKNSRLVVCSGNHDGDSRNEADESFAQWLLDAGTDGLYIDGDSFDLSDTRITVCPWWDGELSRGEIERQLEREAALAPKRWIWVYHAPPEGASTCWSGHKFIGDTFLRKWIERFQPEMVLSGHIHNAPFVDSGSWIDRIGRTWVFNTGHQTGAQPTSLMIDLDAMTAEWNCAWDRSVRDLRAVDGGGAGRDA